MTVTEVKEILQGAGVNLNDAQFEAIHSLLGSGGGGGDSSTEYGVPVTDLTNPRYWLFKLQHNQYPAMTKCVESRITYKDYDIYDPAQDTYDPQDGDVSFLTLKDILDQNNPYYNYNAVDYYDSVLKITQDKLPYIDGIIRHRLIDYLGNYGVLVVNYGELNISVGGIGTCSSFLGDNIQIIPEDWTQHIDDPYDIPPYIDYVRHITTTEEGSSDEVNELMIYHYLSYTYLNSNSNLSFALHFVNFNGDTFENSNELIFVPVLIISNII